MSLNDLKSAIITNPLVVSADATVMEAIALMSGGRSQCDTALAMEGDRDRCLEAGANDYLSKPIKLKQLATIIQQIFDINKFL